MIFSEDGLLAMSSTYVTVAAGATSDSTVASLYATATALLSAQECFGTVKVTRLVGNTEKTCLSQAPWCWVRE